jgi:hypothetical protein
MKNIEISTISKGNNKLNEIRYSRNQMLLRKLIFIFRSINNKLMDFI